ncbi:cytochrome P450 monooxygenase pc-1 [Mycena belliarum]|uniref:Cytochrome P450 monooxygenase pc-1 n=1 Tax=Mycena belliarum TaxID=1033014 RepID=A0AAD6UBS5_9AGAR|nr:cytochrome P450 monooxygenase pc-1 [Mycena belliae]
MPPPGVSFLGRLALRVLSLPIALAVGGHYALVRSGVNVPVWATMLLTLASGPLYLTFRILRRDAHQRREAAAMGARLAPRVHGKRPGNVDLISMMMHNQRHGYPGDAFQGYFDQSPVCNVRILWIDAIFTNCPEHIKQILAADFTNYVKGERFQYGMDSVLGSGVFNSDGEMWKFHRAVTRPFFTRDKIEHFDIFDRHADTAIALMKERIRGGFSVDFQDLIGRFTMDSATEFLFGTCVESLKANVPYAHNVAFPPPQSRDAAAQTANTFIGAFNQSMQVIAEREHLGHIWPLYEIFTDKTAAPMKIVNAFLDPVIHAAVERKRIADAIATEKREVEAETLLDELLNSTSNPKVLKDETLNILLAGRDTTMHVMTIVIYFLSMYSDVCTRLRSEVLEHVGPTRRPTYEDIKDMKYLRAVINESMRLYPPVPFNIRESINATTWSSPDPDDKPIYIPAGCKVPYSVFLMHRRKDLWGPDAEEFSPDRFLDERLKKYLLNNSFAFLPFNAGPRICLGQQFAYNEMSFMLIRLLQAFSSFTLDEDAFLPEGRPPAEWARAPGRKGIDRFRPKLHVTMYTADGMWIKIKEAATAEA